MCEYIDDDDDLVLPPKAEGLTLPGAPRQGVAYTEVYVDEPKPDPDAPPTWWDGWPG